MRIPINQHGWTKIFNVTATTKDENSPDQQCFVGDFRITRGNDGVAVVMMSICHVTSALGVTYYEIGKALSTLGV